MKKGKKKDSWNNNKARNPYSIKPWKDIRPNEKIINCPTNDPIIQLLGAILKGGYLEEGSRYFSGVCKTCSTPYNNKYCGSFWTEIAGVDYTYISRKAKHGGIKKDSNHSLRYSSRTNQRKY